MSLPVFHTGEILAQRQAGYDIRSAPIYRHIPDKHQALLSELTVIAVAGRDPQGLLTIALIPGPAGFLDGRNGDQLHIILPPHWRQDPLASIAAPGLPVGCLAIDFSTRRRVRINGAVAMITPDRLILTVEQCFGNCPRYITPRDTARLATLPAGTINPLIRLDPYTRTLIAAADTALVASASGTDDLANGGVDLSHRGGPPGFIQATESRLSVPDFPGNRYMNTLGNLVRHPHAALMLVDFTTGDQLHVRGRVTIDWTPPEGYPDAERMWHLDIESAWLRRA